MRNLAVCLYLSAQNVFMRFKLQLYMLKARMCWSSVFFSFMKKKRNYFCTLTKTYYGESKRAACFHLSFIFLSFEMNIKCFMALKKA